MRADGKTVRIDASWKERVGVEMGASFCYSMLGMVRERYLIMYNQVFWSLPASSQSFILLDMEPRV